MNGRPIDFHGIIDLDPKIIEQLECYLQEKESFLAHQILSALREGPVPSSQPVLPAGSFMKLSDAIESFTKQVRRPENGGEHEMGQGGGRLPHKEIDCALWEYTEVFEGCVTELFQQVRQVPLDRWHISLAVVVRSIKENLSHRIEDLIWGIKRLEKSLDEQFSAGRGLMHRLFARKQALDPYIVKNLQKTEAFLKAKSSAFKLRYNEFLMLNIQAEEDIERLREYGIFALLGAAEQTTYIDVYRLLKIMELSTRSKKALGEEASRALKLVASVDRVLNLFHLYMDEIRGALYNGSLQWKAFNHEEGYSAEAAMTIKDKASSLKEELRHLMQTMSRYRTFLLKHDANPYVRSRLGFSEWIVGPEPQKAKALADLLYSAEELNELLAQFFESLGRNPSAQQHLEYHAHEQIEKLLHEMGLPLISRSMMRSRAEQFLEAAQECDEIGSPQLSTIDYVADILSKAIRVDWKYHVLHEFPLFHQLFNIHKGLEDDFEDPGHAFRMERFKALFSQILHWVEKGDVYAHVHEIELDMNDMKTYLQEFLAAIQRTGKEKSNNPNFEDAVCMFTQQLLDYRYVFGNFFLSLISKNSDGQQLRQQFLFVDQYFESIENLLKDLSTSFP